MKRQVWEILTNLQDGKIDQLDALYLILKLYDDNRTPLHLRLR
jgi:hypothetical protein